MAKEFNIINNKGKIILKNSVKKQEGSGMSTNQRQTKEQLLLKFIEANSGNQTDRAVVNNAIMQALQYTTDSMKAKILLEEILNRDLQGVDNKTLNVIIDYLTKHKYFNEAISEKQADKKTNQKKVLTQPKQKNKENVIAENTNKNLKKEKNLQSKTSQKEEQFKKQMQLLAEENQRLRALLFHSMKEQYVEIPEEDIQELYVLYKTQNIKKYKQAFVIDGIIPKSYYRIKKEGDE